MVGAQLAEKSLPTPKVSSSNPVIGKLYIKYLGTVNCIEKTKIKEKEDGIGPFFFIKNKLFKLS